MYFLTHTVAVGHDSHITRNHSRYAGIVGCIHNLVHGGNVLAIDDGVDGEVGLYAMFIACGCNLSQVVNCECTCRPCTHIQFANAEIYGVGTSLNGSRKAFS